jgi:hypothetical protein
MSIFPGFPDRKLPVISPTMCGRDAGKHLIRQRYLRQAQRFVGSIWFFAGIFP